MTAPTIEVQTGCTRCHGRGRVSVQFGFPPVSGETDCPDCRTTADLPEPFDRLVFLDRLIGSSRGSRGACLWCGEVLTKADARRDLCNACQALMVATR